MSEADADSGQAAARAVMTRVALCLKVATMHRLDNAAMVTPISGLLAAVNPRLSQGERVTLQVLGDNCYLNKELIRVDFSSTESAAALKAIFKRLAVHEIAFSAPLNDAEVRELVALFQTHYSAKDPTQLPKFPLPKVAFRQVTQAEAQAMGAVVDSRTGLARAMAGLASAIDEQLEAMKTSKASRLSRVRRAIHQLADASAGHEAELVALARFDACAGETAFHLAGVTALTLLIARGLSLSRPMLTDACLAAAFHDAGRDLAGAAPQETPLRTVLGVTAAGFTPDVYERVCAACDVYRPPAAGVPATFGHLVAVACAFDRLVSPPKGYRGVAPQAALRQLAAAAGKRLDPRAVQLLAALQSGQQG
jgi:hypothetical protein